MDIRSNREVTVTITFSEREAKLLTCLLGAISPKDAEDTIKRGIYYKQWIGTVVPGEVSDFTGNLFTILSGLF